jgi:hypothetical protein
LIDLPMPPKSLIPADIDAGLKFDVMQNTISVSIILLGLVLALVGACLRGRMERPRRCRRRTFRVRPRFDRLGQRNFNIAC